MPNKNFVMFTFVFCGYLLSQTRFSNTVECNFNYQSKSGKKIDSNIEHVESSNYILNIFTDTYTYDQHGSKTFSLFIQLRDTTINQLIFKDAFNIPSFRIYGVQSSEVELFDDGTHGDSVANDHIFSRSGIHMLRWGYMTFEYTFNDLHKETVNYWTVLPLYDIAEAYLWDGSIPIVERISSEVQYTSKVVNIVLPRDTILKYVGNNLLFNKVIIDKYLQYFEDDKDFLTVEHAYYQLEFYGFATMSAYKADILGRGKCLSVVWNQEEAYSKSKRLMGFINAFAGHSLRDYVIPHEMLHYWAVKFNFACGDLLDNYSGHWHQMFLPSSGFGDNNGVIWDSYKVLTDSTFRVHYISNDSSILNRKYNLLEQYLMGLVSVDEVPFPIKYRINTGAYIDTYYDTLDGDWWNVFKGDTINDIAKISKEDFLNIQGMRLPLSTQSKKHFTNAMIVVTEKFMEPSDLAIWEWQMKQREVEFPFLTDNRATLSMNIHPIANGNKANGYIVTLDPQFKPGSICPVASISFNSIVNLPKVNTITLMKSGTVSDSDISQGGLYIDKNKNNIIDANDIKVGIDESFVANSLTFRNLDYLPSVSENLIVTFNVSDSAIVNHTAAVFFHTASIVPDSNSQINTNVVLSNNYSLPVSLRNISIHRMGKDVQLNWNTAAEINNYGFDIEKQQINKWEKIGFVEGCGSINTPQEYVFIDKEVNPGKQVYRLKQIDRDGKYEYSNEIEIYVADMPTKYAMFQNYPNPFNPKTVLKFDLPRSSFVYLKIYNSIGQEVAALISENLNAGSYSHEWNADKLPSGVYMYRIQAGDYVETRRMVLLK